MPIRSRRPMQGAFAAIAALAAVLVWMAPPAARAEGAADKGKKKTEGCMVSYDGSGALVVKDKKTKKDETFKVKQATSVLDKNGTIATKNGRGAKLVDLETNRPLIVYWVEQGSDKFASKIDQPDAIDKATGKPDADVMEDAGCKTN